jgi:hypothetical protein
MKDLLKQPHIIFSVQNPMHKPAERAPSHEMMIERLKSQGENAHSMIGKYRLPEKSIIVFNPKSPADIKRIAKVLGQDSIIYSSGGKNALIYVNGDKEGQVEYGAGTKFHEKKPNDFYSVLPDGTVFTHEIGNLKKTEKLFKASEIKLNPEHGKLIAGAYEKMQHNPDDPKVKEAYGALINETKKQFKEMLDSGFKFSKMKSDQPNPYKTSKDVHEDIERNKHLWFFPTEQGFGQEGQSQSHPMLQPTEFQIEGKPLLANDLFRIVHDYRGHHLGGKSSFGPKGEHQAYLTHKKDFSPLAQKALATETMAQNSWFNYGPFADYNKKNLNNPKYAEQKAGLLPDEIISGRWHE